MGEPALAEAVRVAKEGAIFRRGLPGENLLAEAVGSLGREDVLKAKGRMKLV